MQELVISPEDAQIISEYRRLNILQNINTHLVDERDGAVLFGCPDCDQSWDMFLHHGRIQSSCRSDPRIHPFFWHGGAALFAPQCPFVVEGSTIQPDFIREFHKALDMKSLKNFAVYTHIPCGQAYELGINAYNLTKMMFQAKLALKEEFPDVTIAAFTHVDWGPNYRDYQQDTRKQSYFASRELWTNHCAA